MLDHFDQFSAGADPAVARVAGETAPLILTVLGNTHFFQGFNEPIAALPLQIYQDALFQEIGPDSEVHILPQIAGG